MAQTNLRKCFEDFSTLEGGYPTANITGALPREPTHETESAFRAEKAPKRNVAKRPVHVMLGSFYACARF